MSEPRDGAIAALLGNGTVLAAGGITAFTASGFTASARAELFTLR
jgi:hypothetical protein